MSGHRFAFHGMALEALPSGALWWPEGRWLVAADLHLGKSERMARRGGPLLPPYEGLATLARPGGLGDYWVVGFGRGIAGTLHGLDERATPLAVEPRAAALRPRLGWGDGRTHNTPRRLNRRGVS